MAIALIDLPKHLIGRIVPEGLWGQQLAPLSKAYSALGAGPASPRANRFDLLATPEEARWAISLVDWSDARLARRATVALVDLSERLGDHELLGDAWAASRGRADYMAAARRAAQIGSVESLRWAAPLMDRILTYEQGPFWKAYSPILRAIFDLACAGARSSGSVAFLRAAADEFGDRPIRPTDCWMPPGLRREVMSLLDPSYDPADDPSDDGSDDGSDWDDGSDASDGDDGSDASDGDDGSDASGAD